MELRQLQYFLKIAEHRSLSRAAAELGLGVSALSQQVSKLENELSTRLLNRTTTGVTPTSAGIAFLHHAQLAVRQIGNAVHAAQRGRMSGYVSVGLPPTTASVLALPLIERMRTRYPDIQLHLVEMLSGHLASQLNARQLDLAVVFQADAGRRWHVTPLLDEKLFVIAVPTLLDIPEGDTVQIDQLGHVPLVMPSAQHGLRTSIIMAVERSETVPHIVMEIDGLATLMQAVKAGHAATIQPGAAAARLGDAELRMVEISDDHVGRRNFLASLSDDELSPAALATRVVLLEVSRELVNMHLWPGASLQPPEALHRVGL